MGNRAGAVCRGGVGGGSAGAGGSGEEEPGWSPRGSSGETLRSGGLGWREGEGRRRGDSRGRRAGGFSRTSPGSSLLSSTSPLFMPLPLGCQIWLTQSVVSLLRLAPGPKPSALHHRRSPCTRRGRDRGPGGKGPSLNFHSCLPAHSCRLSPRRWGLPGSRQAGPGGRTRAPILERSQGQGRRSDRVAVPLARWRLGGREPKCGTFCHRLAV